ncbi:MAG TPA: BTAD domain-containing putative transcriptional regulator [Candidatus Dormibacteraeota bacterium]
MGVDGFGLPTGKTMLPTATVLLDRPRLADLIAPSPGRLTLLHTPAGYGKTLALLGAPGAAPRRWYNADGSDRTPLQLAQRLAALLRVKRFSPRRDPIPADLAAELAAGLPKGTVTLDVDGAERIGRAPDSFAVLLALLELAPDRLALRLTTRERPPLPLERLRLAGRLTDLGPAQLRFDRDEAARYLRQVTGRTARGYDLDRLETAVEGWPAGIALCATRRDVPDQSEDALQRYAADEVVGPMSAPVRRLLTRLATRPVAVGELSESEADERRALDWIVRERFFVSVDERRYRLHPVLTAVLRSQPSSDERRAGAQPRPSLSIRALGILDVAVNGRVLQPADWRPYGALRLLRLLLSMRHYSIGAEEAAEALWPRHAPRSGLNSVNVSLHGLRRLLEPGLRRGSDSRYVVREGHLYRLCVERIDLDVERFAALATQRRGLARREDLEQAVDLYRGDFLADELYVDYPNDRREQLKTVHLETLERLGDMLLADDELKRGLAIYRRLLAADPLREDVWGRIMKHHLLRGERAAAARAYKTCAEALRTGLGVTPGDDLQAMMREATGTVDPELEPMGPRVLAVNR